MHADPSRTPTTEHVPSKRPAAKVAGPYGVRADGETQQDVGYRSTAV